MEANVLPHWFSECLCFVAEPVSARNLFKIT